MNYKFLLALLIFLPGCWFHRSSRKADCARAAYENVLHRYDHELKIFTKLYKESEKEEKLHLERDLKDEILLRHEEFNDERCHKWFVRRNAYANYPFSQYKQQLDCDINYLVRAKDQLYWKQEGLARSVQNLIEELDRLRRYIVLSREYAEERRMLERLKIIEAKRDSAPKEVIVKRKRPVN